jgi:two-component SAPR family response regulator
MIHVLLIGPDLGIQRDIESFLQKYDDIDIAKALSRWKALDLMAQRKFDLAVIDEMVGKQTGIELAKKLVTIDPIMNCVLISSFPEEAFHEATEGLGILSQLSPRPIASEIDRLVEKLRKVMVQIR